MAKGSERRARKLHPKPEALAARGVTGRSADVLVASVALGDHFDRVADIARAEAYLEEASRMVSMARITIVRIVANSTAAHACADGEAALAKARALTRSMLATLKRAR